MVYLIAKFVIPKFYKLWIRKISGLENIPKKGPFIIAANHSSFYDDLIAHVIIIPRLNIYIHALVNSRYWKYKPVALFLNWGKCIPVYVDKDEKSKQKNEESFKTALYFLMEGEIVQIFPEGARSTDGKIKKAKLGVARISLQSGAPLLPMGIRESEKVLPKGSIFPRFKRCEVIFGKTISFKKNKNPSKEELEKATRTVMRNIANLINKTYDY